MAPILLEQSRDGGEPPSIPLPSHQGTPNTVSGLIAKRRELAARLKAAQAESQAFAWRLRYRPGVEAVRPRWRRRRCQGETAPVTHPARTGDAACYPDLPLGNWRPDHQRATGPAVLQPRASRRVRNLGLNGVRQLVGKDGPSDVWR